MFSNKKAVSPLIATVLLIAFAVALGAVVMNWGKGYVEATAQDTSEKSNLDLSCQQDIELEVKSIGDTQKICYGNGYLEVMLENKGRVSITGMQTIIFDTEDDVDTIENSTLTITASGVTSKLNISHTVGNVSQVEFVPMIKPKGAITSQYCSKNKLVVEDISPC